MSMTPLELLGWVKERRDKFVKSSLDDKSDYLRGTDGGISIQADAELKRLVAMFRELRKIGGNRDCEDYGCQKNEHIPTEEQLKEFE